MHSRRANTAGAALSPEHHRRGGILFEGARNFRDMGGYAAADGRHLRYGMLYRSDALSALTAADLDELHRLDIRLVCDLRSESECARQVSRWPQGQSPRRLNLYINADLHAGNEPLLHILNQDHSADGARRLMLATYRMLPKAFEQRLAELVGCMLQGEGLPVLFHCTAGKDRTGFVGAMLMLALGIPADSVFDDYMLTNSMFDMQQRREGLVAAMAERIGRAPDDAVVDALLVVAPEYLGAAFDAIRADYGSVDAYLERICGAGAPQRAQLQAMLLA